MDDQERTAKWAAAAAFGDRPSTEQDRRWVDIEAGDRPWGEAQAHQEYDASRASQYHASSRSVSLPWRRPRPSTAILNELRTLPQSSQDAIDDTYDEYPLPFPQETQGTRVKGMFRRASISIKSRFQRRPSLGGENLAYEGRTSAQRPTTSHSTWNRIRQAATLKHSRSTYGLNLTHEPAPFFQPVGSQSFLIPGAGAEPPVIPRNTGAAAKASAALQNEYLASQGLQNRWLYPTQSDESNDVESGIGISATIPGISPSAEEDMSRAANISKIDFIAQLPSELAIHLLGLLDAPALIKASLVSRRWHDVVGSQHIWRDACLREMGVTYATSAPVVPNTGLGLPLPHPDCDWRQVYRVKKELARRWRAGKVARPVYLNGHSDSIYCLQFDEHKIITGSRDKTIRVWDMHTYTCSLVISPPEELPMKDEDGDPVHFASSSDNHRINNSFPNVVTFTEHHSASILCLQYDDEILVTGSSDATCLIHDVKNGYQPIRRLRHHTAAVLDLAFDEKHIVTCSKDISICVWDRHTGALVRQLRGHTGPVNAVQMRGNTIVSCSGDFRVKLWNIETGKNIREFTGHNKGLACCQFSEDGRYVASAGNDKVIRIWDANTGECIQEMRAHDGLVRSLHIDSVSGRLVSGSYDTDIKVWHMESGLQLLDFPRWHASWVLSAKSDYRRIVSTGQDPKILIMDFGADVEGIELLESKQR